MSDTPGKLMVAIGKKPIIDGKPLSEMTDVELDWKLNELQDRLADVEAVRNSPKFKKKFENQTIPPINPAFTAMLEAVKAEVETRKGKANEHA